MVDQQNEASSLSTAQNAARKISCKTWNSPVEYFNRECKHDIQEYEGNMFNSIFKENVQGRKHHGSCACAQPGLISYRKPKPVVQKVLNGYKIPNNNHNYHDEDILLGKNTPVKKKKMQKIM